MRTVLFLVLALAPLAAQADDKLTPQQLSDYVALLYADRAQQQIEIDRLKLLIEDQKRAIAAANVEKNAVDDYWRRYLGLDPQQ